MPISKETAHDKIGNPSPGDVWIFVDKLGGAKYFNGATIPLDGNRYKCDGIALLKNGTSLRAKFSVTASSTEIIIDNAICYFNGLWYRSNDDELFSDLGIKMDEAIPMLCLPDRKIGDLDGPFPIGKFLVN